MIGELNQEQIERLLRSEVVGRIGCHADGATYVVPMTYAYDGDYVYGHSAEGRKLRMMRENPKVCFEVDRLDDLANWQSVIADGTFEELHGEEAKQVMQFLMARYRPMLTSETSQPSPRMNPTYRHHDGVDGQAPVVYRIFLVHVTGRFEKH